MSPIYQEEIGPNMAKQILQDEFIEGSHMKYFLISEYMGSTVLQHNEETGEDTETRLVGEIALTEEEIKPILSYVGDYRDHISIGSVIQWVIMIIVVIVVAACIYFLH